ncbi:hypothetical protein HN873_067110, partial [Arachis hypogaea]
FLIYLFDDPFSAIVTHTTAHSFNECVMTALRKKIVILVTHQVEFLSEVVTEGGKITQSASTSDSEALLGTGGSNANNQWHGFFKLLKKGSQMSFQPFHPFKKNVPKLIRRKSKRVREDLIPSFDSEFANFKSSWKNFTLSELQAATDDFSHDNMIGEGGYAEVYLGKLEDGNFVAI